MSLGYWEKCLLFLEIRGNSLRKSEEQSRRLIMIITIIIDN